MSERAHAGFALGLFVLYRAGAADGRAGNGATFDAEDPVVIRTIAARRIAQKLDVRASYEQIARVLNEEGVDHFLIETCASIAFASAAVAACRSVSPTKELWLAFTLQNDAPMLWSGEPIALAVQCLAALPHDALLALAAPIVRT